MPKDKAHEYYGSIMKAHQKFLPDGSSMGKGYEIYLNQNKAAYMAKKINKQKKNWKQ